MNVARLRTNLASVRERLARAAVRSGRPPGSVRLVAVTKTIPPEWTRALVALGQIDLGENYPQELWQKVESLSGLRARWHLIGHLQSNKAKRTLPLAAALHGVDSLPLLQSLDELAQRLALDNPPAIFLQVNVSGEEAKHGWTPEQILAEADALAAIRLVPIVGLMGMAALGGEAEEARPAFVRLRELRDQLRERTGLPLADLSMGMSNDFEVAVEEGATWVRIGSALFEGVAG